MNDDIKIPKGSDLAKDWLIANTTSYHFQVPKPPTWKWCIGGDWHSFTVTLTSRPPNRINRFFMKYFLGIHSQLL